jgi:hypothetical protein
MLFKKIITYYFENHTKPIRADLLTVEAGGTYSYH